MQYLYAVSFVFQHPKELQKVQNCIVVFEGLKGWSTDQVLAMGRLELPKQGIKIEQDFKEIVASWVVSELGAQYV